MVRDRRVRLAVFPAQFVFGEVREEDRCGGGGGERPLEEVDFGGLLLRVLLLVWGFGGHGARKGEDELRVALGGGFDAPVGLVGDAGAEGLCGGGVAEAPDVFDFFGRQGEGFGDVDEGGEGFDAGWGWGG